MVQQILNQAKKRMRRDAGFTLMELLIVIAIIAVLVAIAIPAFSGQLNNAKDAADQANARALYALAQVDWMDSANHETTTDFQGLDDSNKYRVQFEDGSTQSFTFSDRTEDVQVTFEDNGAHVRVVSKGNDGAGYDYPEG